MVNFFSLIFFGISGIIAGVVQGFFQCALSYFKAFSYSFDRNYSLKTKAKFGEPSQEKYFFNKQYEDLLNTYESAKSINTGNILRLKGELEVRSHFTYYRVKAAQKVIYIVGALLNAVFFSIHFLIITVISLPVYMLYFMVMSVEKIKFVRGRIWGVCPHCLSKFNIPYYVCPNCGRVHKVLTPGPYGIIKRKCKCKKVIPCTNLGGRFKLKALCPVCGKDIESRESSPICIPVVGPKSSGKTSFVYSAISTLIEHISGEKKWNMRFLNQESEEKIHRCVALFKKGIPPEKTANNHTDVYNVFINSHKFASEKLLYLYDIAGEYFNLRSNIRIQNHYKYIQGLVFIIDPLCMAHKEKYVKKENFIKINSVNANVHDFIDRFILGLREINQIELKKLIPVPLAVIVNKMDLFNYDGDIEDFLRDIGEDTIIKKFEYNFANYKFFPCSLVEDGDYKWGLKEAVSWILNESNNELKVGSS
ncbi:hypothetical protein ACJDU8_18680 [Clostridium sp. WILCCON 0269]|uniref:Double-GTPase 2 domain-containing protein n=1 Tax=Candidatus Clostridium eludens TaxID=3381663 RepID=A0ABW8SQZ4_9CLOT